MIKGNGWIPELTVGLDLSDRRSTLCAIDREGEILERARIATTKEALKHRFSGTERARIVLEVGPHSPWVSRLLEELGHEVIPANPRKLRLIYENPSKDDDVDAEYLARVGRLDPELLAPVRHREVNTQADLAVLRARALLVKQRTALVNHVRGAVKGVGGRLPSCSTPSFPKKVAEHIPEELHPALMPMMERIQRLNREIRRYDRTIEGLCEDKYPETTLLQQIAGVGALTSLCYVLVIEDPTRFKTSRSVGPYVGLVPGKDQSGDSDPPKGITKSGDELLRTLLVQSAHYILGPFGPDCDLRRWGMKLVDRGGPGAKNRAAVAVARKLAVLLHHLWVTGEVYDPFHHSAGEDFEAEDDAA